MVSLVQIAFHYLGRLEIILGCVAFLLGNRPRAAGLVIAGVGLVVLKHVVGLVHVLLLGVEGQLSDILCKVRGGRRPSLAEVARPLPAVAAAAVTLTIAVGGLYGTLWCLDPAASFRDFGSHPTISDFIEVWVMIAPPWPLLAALYVVGTAMLVLTFYRSAANGR